MVVVVLLVVVRNEIYSFKVGIQSVGPADRWRVSQEGFDQDRGDTEYKKGCVCVCAVQHQWLTLKDSLKKQEGA